MPRHNRECSDLSRRQRLNSLPQKRLDACGIGFNQRFYESKMTAFLKDLKMLLNKTAVHPQATIGRLLRRPRSWVGNRISTMATATGTLSPMATMCAV